MPEVTIDNLPRRAPTETDFVPGVAADGGDTAGLSVASIAALALPAAAADATTKANAAKARSNHTGTQAIGTVVGLEDALADLGESIAVVDAAAADAMAAAVAVQAYAVQRANHAGTQAMDTIDGLLDALDGKQAAGDYAPLDGGGKVPAAYLPSYVDDVLEFADLASFPVTGESDKIYLAIDTLLTYRWSGSAYAEISASPGTTDAVPEGATNLYYTTGRALADVTWGTIDGKPSTFAPTAHASSHAIGGSDQVVVSQLGSVFTLSGSHSKGIALDGTSRTITQANTLAIMGGSVGVGTLTPGKPFEVSYAAPSSASQGFRLTNPTVSSASYMELGVGGNTGYDRYGVMSMNGIIFLLVTPSGAMLFNSAVGVSNNVQIYGDANSNAYMLLNNGSGTRRDSCVTQWEMQVSYVTKVTLTASAVNLASGVVLQVAGTQVVSSRKTGWAAATGTATRTAFATATATTEEVAQRLKALIDDLISHGLIGA